MFTGNSFAVIVTCFNDDAVAGLCLEIEQLAIPHRHVASEQVYGELVDSFGILLRQQETHVPVSSY